MRVLTRRFGVNISCRDSYKRAIDGLMVARGECNVVPAGGEVCFKLYLRSIPYDKHRLVGHCLPVSIVLVGSVT